MIPLSFPLFPKWFSGLNFKRPALVICNFPFRWLSTFLSGAIFMVTAVEETWAVNRIQAAVMFLPKTYVAKPPRSP